MKLNLTIFLFLLILVGCQSREIRPKGTGTGYFPLKSGGYWVYDVEETKISQVGGQTAETYELKIEITDSLALSSGTTYVLQRFKRPDASQAWTATGTWSASKDQFQAIVQEGNVTYVRLSFPMLEGKTWDGNKLNNLGGTERCADGSIHCDNYVEADLNKRFESPGIAFDNTVTIVENNMADPIVGQDVRTSVYANAIGLVYHESILLAYCTVGTCIGKQVVDNGVILKQTIKSYGGL